MSIFKPEGEVVGVAVCVSVTAHIVGSILKLFLHRTHVGGKLAGELAHGSKLSAHYIQQGIVTHTEAEKDGIGIRFTFSKWNKSKSKIST